MLKEQRGPKPTAEEVAEVRIEIQVAIAQAEGITDALDTLEKKQENWPPRYQINQATIAEARQLTEKTQAAVRMLVKALPDDRRADDDGPIRERAPGQGDGQAEAVAPEETPGPQRASTATTREQTAALMAELAAVRTERAKLEARLAAMETTAKTAAAPKQGSDGGEER